VRGLDLSAFSRWRDPCPGLRAPPQATRTAPPARRASAAPARAPATASARGNGIVCVGALFKGAEALDYPPWLDAPPAPVRDADAAVTAGEDEATPALLEYI
jgi:hypothetical protein